MISATFSIVGAKDARYWRTFYYSYWHSLKFKYGYTANGVWIPRSPVNHVGYPYIRPVDRKIL